MAQARTEVVAPVAAPQPAKRKNYLTPEQLVERWDGRIKKQTLTNWRHGSGDGGPSYTKLGGRILYELEDIESYERRGKVNRDRPAKKN